MVNRVHRLLHHLGEDFTLATQRPQTMRFLVSIAALVALATMPALQRAPDRSYDVEEQGHVEPYHHVRRRRTRFYAQSGVANTPSKVTLNWHFIAENVKGVPPNSAQKNNDVSTISPPMAQAPTR